MPVLTKVYFRPPIYFVAGLRKKNWWSILETCATSPIFNQFTSELLHSVLHLRVYNVKRAYEFVCYIGYFLSQQKVDEIYFSSDFFLIMVRHISIFNIFISFFYIAYSTWWISIYQNNEWKIYHRSKHAKAKKWNFFFRRRVLFVIGVDWFIKKWEFFICIRSCPSLISCYRHKYGYYILDIWPVCHHMHSNS